VGAGAGALATALYVAALLYAHKFWRQQKQPEHKWLRTIICLGLLCHSLSLVSVMAQPQGLELGLFAVMSLAAFATTALLACASYQQPALAILTPVLLAISAICIPVSHLFQPRFSTQSHLTLSQSGHILLSITAWATLILAGIQSFVANFQAKALKRGKMNSLMAGFPPLQTTERVLFELLTLGWILLTFAIGTGFIAFENLLAQKLVHKTFFTAIAWFMLAIVLAGHWFAGWRGQTTLRAAQWGIALMLIGYIGSKIALEIIFKS
jgi:ABC-type uncharacterized transport system permease subunit